MSVKKIVAGNWKMNLNYKEAGMLFDDLQAMAFPADVEVIICPPALYLSEFAMRISESSKLRLAAQNVHFMPNGAFTGEISATMLASLNIAYCLVGHSERRQFFGETDESVSKKVSVLLQNGIIPVICVGEMLDERYSQQHMEIVRRQVLVALDKIEGSMVSKVILAYEPVWAIGTGQTATTAQAQEMHAFIRELLVNHYGQETGETVPLLYGGSCNAANAGELFSQQDVNGGLIGGASLKAEDFIKIIHSF